ncbi:hypothetical protein AMS68_003734 [Peltaster fructicola]|uniref:Uncharacterized protein n=1 Tax=Peltaster fructicola TaxID=286661 RepID=A0A6H0XTW8_9PEZI|nr:hypothetical protein AMS68_003734 [Peltaster fructicola]
MTEISFHIVCHYITRVAAGFLALLMLICLVILTIIFLFVWQLLARLLLAFSTLLANCMEDQEFAVIRIDVQQRDGTSVSTGSMHTCLQIDFLPEELAVDPVLAHTVAMNRSMSERIDRKNADELVMTTGSSHTAAPASQNEWSALATCRDGAILWPYDEPAESVEANAEKQSAQNVEHGQEPTQKHFIEELKTSNANFSWNNKPATNGAKQTNNMQRGNSNGGNRRRGGKRGNKHAGGLPHPNAPSTTKKSTAKPGSFVPRRPSMPAGMSGSAPSGTLTISRTRLSDTKPENIPLPESDFVHPHLRSAISRKTASVVPVVNQQDDLIPGLSAMAVEHSSTPVATNNDDLFDQLYDDVDYPVMESMKMLGQDLDGAFT